ncbi:UXX-star selenoprotein family 1 [Pseudodesulfovibrio piezophilus]|uniref:Glutaredoxin n=1 Tax=Pseudodesulfovibrio piezophilus (strain DSM 21447 / JCM 15486 / C1TLV30) TaxID=1322246 RepID=M1WP37_PSEP2|nr:UXX-star (seleno)protein family 1 [Pseudodesulfovibrio piezophilus]CCH48009.1 Glutaredoxin [Pseudodesulfovibrio piezophilus C1TLV30]
MAEVVIYGKPACPHTQKALNAYPEAEFRDVLASSQFLEESLHFSGGQRRIPVILKNGEPSIGFNGGS